MNLNILLIFDKFCKFCKCCVNKLYGNLAKCTFCNDKVIFLGFVVSKHGVEVDESKIEAIKNWPILMNISQIRSFLGLAGFYRRL